MKIIPSLLLCLILAPTAWSQNNPFANPGSKFPAIGTGVLPVDEAFALQAFIEAPDQVVLIWNIREGYYLYRDSIAALTPGNSPVDIGELPEGTLHTDEFFGDVEVYYHRALHRIAMEQLPEENGHIAFTLMYQGCAEDKYCYPVQEKKISLALP